MTSKLPYAPDEHFRKLPCTQRRAMASDLLAAFQEGRKNILASRTQFQDLHGLVAYVKVKQEVEIYIDLWRREMRRAAWETNNKKAPRVQGAALRSRHMDVPLFASLAGSFSDALNQSGNAGKVAT